MLLGNLKNISLKLGRGIVQWLEALGIQARGLKVESSRTIEKKKKQMYNMSVYKSSWIPSEGPLPWEKGRQQQQNLQEFEGQHI